MAFLILGGGIQTRGRPKSKLLYTVSEIGHETGSEARGNGKIRTGLQLPFECLRPLGDKCMLHRAEALHICCAVKIAPRSTRAAF